MIETGFLITAFATLFVVIDPPGLVPLFIALTQGMDNERRRAMALRACIIATVLLLLFGLAGETVLEFIGISMPALSASHFRLSGISMAMVSRRMPQAASAEGIRAAHSL